MQARRLWARLRFKFSVDHLAVVNTLLILHRLWRCTTIFGMISGMISGMIFGTIARADGELRVGIPQPQKTQLVPALLLGRSTLNASGCTCHFGEEYDTDLELAGRLLRPFGPEHRFALGIEARQLIGRVDNRDGFDLLATKVGVRLEVQPGWRYRPAFGASWFFGDTLAERQHDEQFNGNTIALSGGIFLGPVRWLIEVSGGSYRDGPGFIALSRPPGEALLAVRSLKVGAEIPFEVDLPDWLELRNQSQSENPVVD